MHIFLAYALAFVLVFGGANFCWTGNERLKQSDKEQTPFPREVYFLWILSGLILFGVSLNTT